MHHDQNALRNIASQCRQKIVDAKEAGGYFAEPFQHIVIDSFLPDEFAKAALSAFPSVSDPSWERSDDAGLEIKARSNWQSEFDIPDGLISTIRVLNSTFVLSGISNVLSIPKLMPDPFFTGGGLNMTEKNGLLDIHVDGNYHDATGMHRRVNLLLYLNPGWSPDWGGEFGVYDERGENLVSAIAPTFNRCVIFDTHDKSFHGLPNPINFPEANPRRSIILYYYTVAQRDPSIVEVAAPHSALWKSKGMLDKRGNKTRKFT